MNAEEFLEKHFDVIRDSIGLYLSHFEEYAETRAIESRIFPKNPDLKDSAESAFRIVSRGETVRDDLIKLARKMGKL